MNGLQRLIPSRIAPLAAAFLLMFSSPLSAADSPEAVTISEIKQKLAADYYGQHRAELPSDMARLQKAVERYKQETDAKYGAHLEGNTEGQKIKKTLDGLIAAIKDKSAALGESSNPFERGVLRPVLTAFLTTLETTSSALAKQVAKFESEKPRSPAVDRQGDSQDKAEDKSARREGTTNPDGGGGSRNGGSTDDSSGGGSSSGAGQGSGTDAAGGGEPSVKGMKAESGPPTGQVAGKAISQLKDTDAFGPSKEGDALAGGLKDAGAKGGGRPGDSARPEPGRGSPARQGQGGSLGGRSGPGAPPGYTVASAARPGPAASQPTPGVTPYRPPAEGSPGDSSPGGSPDPASIERWLADRAQSRLEKYYMDQAGASVGPDKTIIDRLGNHIKLPSLRDIWDKIKNGPQAMVSAFPDFFDPKRGGILEEHYEQLKGWYRAGEHGDKFEDIEMTADGRDFRWQKHSLDSKHPAAGIEVFRRGQYVAPWILVRIYRWIVGEGTFQEIWRPKEAPQAQAEPAPKPRFDWLSEVLRRAVSAGAMSAGFSAAGALTSRAAEGTEKARR